MESFNVVLKLTVEEGKKIAEILGFKAEVEQGLIDQYAKQLADADDGHGNPKEFLANLINERRGEKKQISYLLAAVNDAVRYAEYDTGEPF